jgi:Uma2 family endonuclease
VTVTHNLDKYGFNGILYYGGEMSTAFEKIEEKDHYTYSDYMEWDEDVRAEIINGYIYMMSPPLTIHQRIAGRLLVKLANFLEGKTCEAFIAPFGVRLFPKEDKSDDTVVEPDITVVCDPLKIDDHGCNGPPDLIIEILSPSTRQKDRMIKLNLYQKAMVREYWIVFPENKEIEVHILEEGRYNTQVYGVKEDDDIPEIIPVTVLPGLTIDTKNIF